MVPVAQQEPPFPVGSVGMDAPIKGLRTKKKPAKEK